MPFRRIAGKRFQDEPQPGSMPGFELTGDFHFFFAPDLKQDQGSLIGIVRNPVQRNSHRSIDLFLPGTDGKLGQFLCPQRECKQKQKNVFHLFSNYYLKNLSKGISPIIFHGLFSVAKKFVKKSTAEETSMRI